MTEMTIRKANYDRKMLDKKISVFVNDVGSQVKLFGFYRESLPTIGTLTPDQFVEQCKSNWQKFNDLIKTREILNEAVMKANGAFSAEVGPTIEVKSYNGDTPRKVSIAIAIARKNYYINTLRPLFASIQSKFQKFSHLYETRSNDLKNSLMAQVNSQYGSDSNAAPKARIEYQNAIAKDYNLILLNPLDIGTVVAKNLEEIDDYIANIDSLISNATETNKVVVDL